MYKTVATTMNHLHLTRNLMRIRGRHGGTATLTGDAFCDVGDVIAEKWQWANEVSMETGKYPDQEILRFLGTIEMETAH